MLFWRHTIGLMLLLVCICIPVLAKAGEHSASVEPALCSNLPAEGDLERRYPEITAFWQQRVEYGQLPSPAVLTQPDDYRVHARVPLAYAILRRPEGGLNRANIVIANGRTESFVKYKEMAVTLWCRGYSVYMLDHRGQGLSGRVLAFDAQLSELKKDETAVQYGNRGHVENFDNYVADLQAFVISQVPNDSPRVLLAHSMGGAIGVLLVQQHPGIFQLAVLSSPMLGVPGQFVCPGAARMEALLGGDSYLPGTGPWIQEERYPYRDDWGFNVMVGWHYTSSPVRHNIWHREFAQPLSTPDGRLEDLRTGASTFSWFEQSCVAVTVLMSDAQRFDIPMLLLIAGDDTVIPRSKQQAFCSELNRLADPVVRCEQRLIEGARHEIFIERDELREPALEAIFDFLDRQLGHLATAGKI